MPAPCTHVALLVPFLTPMIRCSAQLLSVRNSSLKLVNTRAMVKLNDSLNRKVLLGGVPKLDNMLEEFVQEAIDNSQNCGDDVAEPDDDASSCSS